MLFNDLGLSQPILKALQDSGYKNPTPIQAQSIPPLLEGRDLLGTAQTGTGKTAAFAIPIIEQLLDSHDQGRNRRIKALVVTPTRELAIQIEESFTAYAKYTDVRNTVIFGGVKQGNQTKALNRGVDVLIATPGRLLDLIGQGFITLKHIEHIVLDEADQMLDMGFIHDIKKLLKMLPKQRQSLFFSATMPPAIVKLSNEILDNYVRVSIEPEQTTAKKVNQVIYHVNKTNKDKLLAHLIRDRDMDSVLVFSRTKHGANKIVRKLEKAGIHAAPIHGNKSQTARQKALQNFKDGKLTALVATDIAARGIDVDELGYVINYDLPNVSETYVHRIGRTGRAGASGIAISFCSYEEQPYLKDIEKLIKEKVAVEDDHPFPFDKENISISNKQNNRGGGRNRKPGNRNRNRSKKRQSR